MASHVSSLIKENNVKVLGHFTFLDNEVVWYCAEDESWSVLASRSGTEENFRERETVNPFGVRLSTMFASECVLLTRRASRSDIAGFIQQVA
jgi:hypothetical protein